MQVRWLDRVGLTPGRFRLLLITLLAYCIGASFFRDAEMAANGFGLLLLAAAIVELQKDETRLIRITVGVIAALSILARASSFVGTLEDVPLVTNLLDVLLAVVVTWAVSSAVLRPRRPAADRVVGAICVYMMIGFAWASIYSTIEIAAPGSFRIPSDLPAGDASFSFLYFSFVTLSTIGYGDITPVSRVAGTFAWMEAVAGQLYIAITIASLLSAAIMEKRRSDDKP